MTTTILFRTEQPLIPLALDVIKAAARNVYGPDTPLRLAPASSAKDWAVHFGNITDGPGVRTLSPSQIVTAANAVTALVQAFTLYQRPPDKVVNYWKLVTDPGWLVGREVLSVDLEWAPDERILCLSATDGNETAVFPADADLVAVANRLRDTKIVGWNWKSDARVLYKQTGVAVDVWFDGMLAHHNLHIGARGRHGLEDVAVKMLGVEPWEHVVKKFAGTGKNADYSKVPSEILYEYNALDVSHTYRLYEIMHPLVSENSAFKLVTDASHMLRSVEQYGIAIDVSYVETLGVELSENIANVLIPEGLNPNSPKQVKERLADTGLVLKSTSADVLEEYRGHEIVDAILEYRGHSKAKSTYVDAYLRDNVNGILYPTFNLHGTSTGRLSSNNPNAQNVPSGKRFRKIFTVRDPNNVLIGCDYKNAELRTMSMLSGDPNMQALFQPGMPDYFDSMMVVAYPHLFTDLSDFEKFHAQNPEDSQQLRRLLKTVIFGLSYNRQAKAIAKALDIEVAEAQKVINDILRANPVFAQWRQDVMEAAVNPAKRDMLVTPFGRTFEAEVISHRNRHSIINAALAFGPQSTASDICLQAAVMIHKALQENGSKTHIVCLVHDEILCEGPEDEAEDVLELKKSLMAESARSIFGDTVPFMVDGKIGKSWADV